MAAAADFLLAAPATASSSSDTITGYNQSHGSPGDAGVGAALGSALAKGSAGPKAADAAGVTAGGQATDRYGNKLGPSGDPQVNQPRHSTEKGAKDAARQEGDRAPVKHPNPTRGEGHYQAADKQGNKIPNSTHHIYPD